MGSGSQLSVKKCVRAPVAGGTAATVFFGLGKINFLRSLCTYEICTKEICFGVGFWYIMRKKRARSRSHDPEMILFQELVTWASLGSGSQLSVKNCVRAPVAGGTAATVFFGLGKIKFPEILVH